MNKGFLRQRKGNANKSDPRVQVFPAAWVSSVNELMCTMV